MTICKVCKTPREVRSHCAPCRLHTWLLCGFFYWIAAKHSCFPAKTHTHTHTHTHTTTHTHTIQLSTETCCEHTLLFTHTQIIQLSTETCCENTLSQHSA
jgi:hypothetical protein